MHATKWTRDAGSTSGSWRRSYIQNFHPKTNFMLCVTVAQSFCLNPFFPLNIVGSYWLTPFASPHLGEPPNGLKFLTKGNQLRANPLYFQNHAKSIPNSSLNKSNPSQNTKLVSWGIKASSTTQKPVISNIPNSI